MITLRFFLLAEEAKQAMRRKIAALIERRRIDAPLRRDCHDGAEPSPLVEGWLCAAAVTGSGTNGTTAGNAVVTKKSH
jgi:hypothetical protein